MQLPAHVAYYSWLQDYVPKLLISQRASGKSSHFQRLAALKWRIQLLATGVKAVRTALAVVRRITNELEKELRICDDDTLKYLEKMKDEESKLRDTLVTLSGELDSEVHQVEAEISKLEDKMTELGMELMKRNSNLGMQLKEDQVELVKKNSKLELELKERNEEKVELGRRNSYLEMQVSKIKEEKVELELDLENQKKHMESEENGWKKEATRILGRNKALKKQKNTLLKVVWKLLKEKEEALLAGNGNDENSQQDVSPLQNLVDRLPNTMKTILAPKGSITGDEFGVFMGGFINMAAYIVTRANRKVGITAMSALASLTSLMISTMFNNIVTYILTVRDDQPSVVKAFTSLPWIMLGGVLPIVIGVFLVVSYKVPRENGLYFVILGVLGMAIAAGVPDLLEWIVKLSAK
ncbi:hypothetical protein Bca4012_018176 [Brassica carinata]